MQTVTMRQWCCLPRDPFRRPVRRTGARRHQGRDADVFRRLRTAPCPARTNGAVRVFSRIRMGCRLCGSRTIPATNGSGGRGRLTVSRRQRFVRQHERLVPIFFEKIGPEFLNNSGTCAAYKTTSSDGGPKRSINRLMIWSRAARNCISLASRLSPRPLGSRMGQYSTSR